MSGAPALVLVVGVGRSGTSLVTGILGRAGFRIPQPEVQADSTNPRGFSEPAWVVALHKELLRKRAMTVLDGRPGIWEATTAAAEDPALAARVRDWLAGQLDGAEAVAVKDPRIAWFLPLWTRAAGELGARTSFLTMLRHPAAVLVSARSSYGDWQSDASRAAAWVSIMLETERRTRGAARAFVRYDALMGDWAPEMARVGELLGLPLLQGDVRARHPQVDELVDPSLRRSSPSWSEVDVPERLRELAEATWEQFGRLTDPGGEDPAVHAALDRLRGEYGTLYAEAEAISQSTAHAERILRRRAQRPRVSPARRLARRALRRLRSR